MSKIGKQPVVLGSDVTAVIGANFITVKGPKGEIQVPMLSFVKGSVADQNITFSLDGSSKKARMNWGTLRALTENAVIGVRNGFEKNLEIEGVGFRALMEGTALVLHVGYSHPVKLTPPAGITVVVEKNIIKVSGIDKYAVGQFAANVRAIKKPEPYKGKGIRYKGEFIRRKAGKKVAGTTA